MASLKKNFLSLLCMMSLISTEGRCAGLMPPNLPVDIYKNLSPQDLYIKNRMQITNEQEAEKHLHQQRKIGAQGLIVGEVGISMVMGMGAYGLASFVGAAAVLANPLLIPLSVSAITRIGYGLYETGTASLGYLNGVFPLDALEQLERTLVVKARHLPETTVLSIGAEIIRCRTTAFCNPEQVSKFQHRLDFPFEFRQPNKVSYQDALSAFSQFDQADREYFADLTMRIIYLNQPERVKPSVVGTLSHLYPRENHIIWGDSRTGKTTAIETVGKLTGLPVCSEPVHPDYVWLVGYGVPGYIGDCMLKYGVKNPIILFDDKTAALMDAKVEAKTIYENPFLGFIMHISDTSKTGFESPYFGFSIDMTHVPIIVTGNEEVKNTAILNRFTVKKISDMTVAGKKRILQERKEELLRKDEVLQAALSGPVGEKNYADYLLESYSVDHLTQTNIQALLTEFERELIKRIYKKDE